MSLKDIFDKQQAFSNITTNVNIEEIGKEIESPDYIRSYLDLSNRNISDVDWEEPSQFARYGSAQKYYEDSIKQIYSSYPYDGSLKEKIDWHNENSELANYIFENRYPRYNGYITMGKEYGNITDSQSGYSLTDKNEYIYFNGTMNISEKASSSEEHFELSNKLSKQNNLSYNLDVNGQVGNTIEFYFKKEESVGTESNKQVIFDMWNGETYGTDGYGRLRVETHPGVGGEENKFFVELVSGSDGFSLTDIGSNLSFDSWNHYAISFINSNGQIKIELYLNGDRVEEKIVGTEIGQITKAVKGHLGSCIAKIPGTLTDLGYGKLHGSLDEFRFWKVRRNDKEIARHYFLNIGSGVNTDLSNTDLGIYYKFNEGIFSADSISTYDKMILDYSGRTSNGTWVGYSLGERSTDSAVVLSGNAKKEFKDPVVYQTHPEVLEILEHYSSYGKEYDLRNENSLYSTLPDWISEQDSDTGYKIKNLMQVMSGFLDEINLKIEALPKIKNMNYGDEEQLSFVRKVLQNVGFKSLNLFEDSSLLEEFLSRTEDGEYEEKLYKIKNEIYKNIYNNIINIYKSKGTNKSFRNLLHCFGIDESLVQLKTYSDNLEYVLEDRYRNHTSKKKVINFNDADRFYSTIYQKDEPGNQNSIGYLPGSITLADFGNTFETSFLFPKKFGRDSKNYLKADFTDVSLFGVHQSENGTWENPDNASIHVFFRKEEKESSNGYFVLSAPCFSKEVSSDLIKDVYNNEKWDISFRIRKEKPSEYSIEGSDTSDYVMELYGNNFVQDIKQNSFLISEIIPKAEAEQYFQANKMIFAGAHRSNFTDSVLMRTDVKLNHVRFWNNYIEDEDLDIHSIDLDSFGPSKSYEDIHSGIKNIDTLCLFWNFETVDSTDSNGQFIIQDISSGSLDLLETNDISQYTKYQFTGIGDKFQENKTDFVDLQYISSARRNLPEDINSDNFIGILEEDDEIYAKDSIPVNNYFSIEKSMYSIISKDMLDWIGTVKDFNTLLGEPKQRYEQEYTKLEKLRNLFFRNVENEPDFETFSRFYKWIDEAILNSILQIVPASLNVVDNVFNIYESHILERNKYQHKLPTVEFKGKNPVGVLQGLVQRNNSWKNGCLSSYNRTTQNIQKRSELSNAINKEINRQNKLIYNFESKEMPVFQDKKRETSIIITEVGFDLTGQKSFTLDDLLVSLKDC